MIQLIVGLLIGAFVGVAIMCMCFAAASGDRSGEDGAAERCASVPEDKEPQP